MSKEISQMRMASRCEHGSSRCVGEWGGGVRGLTCLQDEMEKLLAATGARRTSGRGMRREEQNPSSILQCGGQTNSKHSFPGGLTFKICGPRGSHTSDCAAEEKTEKGFCLQASEQI